MIQVTPRAEIRRLRRQMLIHSYIYYQLDDSLITDDEWQRRANRLVELQAQFPNAKVKCYDDAFIDWDGSTGCHLPVDHWVSKIANRLIYYRDIKLVKRKAKVKVKKKVKKK